MLERERDVGGIGLRTRHLVRITQIGAGISSAQPEEPVRDELGLHTTLVAQRTLFEGAVVRRREHGGVAGGHAAPHAVALLLKRARPDEGRAAVGAGETRAGVGRAAVQDGLDGFRVQLIEGGRVAGTAPDR